MPDPTPRLPIALIPPTAAPSPPPGFGLWRDLARAEGWDLRWGDHDLPPPGPALHLTLGHHTSDPHYLRELPAKPPPTDLTAPRAATASALQAWAPLAAAVRQAAIPLPGQLSGLQPKDLRVALYHDAVLGVAAQVAATPEPQRWAVAAEGAILLTGWALGGTVDDADGRSRGLRVRRETDRSGRPLRSWAWEWSAPLKAAAELCLREDLLPAAVQQRCAEALYYAPRDAWSPLGANGEELRSRLPVPRELLLRHTLGGDRGPQRPPHLQEAWPWDEPVRLFPQVVGPGPRWAVASLPELEPLLALWARGVLTPEAP